MELVPPLSVKLVLRRVWNVSTYASDFFASKRTERLTCSQGSRTYSCWPPVGRSFRKAKVADPTKGEKFACTSSIHACALPATVECIRYYFASDCAGTGLPSSYKLIALSMNYDHTYTNAIRLPGAYVQGHILQVLWEIEKKKHEEQQLSKYSSTDSGARSQSLKFIKVAAA